MLTRVPKEKLVCLHCSKVIECKMNVFTRKRNTNSQPCKFRDAVKVKVLVKYPFECLNGCMNLIVIRDLG